MRIWIGSAFVALGFALILSLTASPTGAVLGSPQASSIQALGFAFLLVGLGILAYAPLRSRIHDDKGLSRLAQQAATDQSVQKEMDDLVHRLLEGNENAGIGTARLPGTNISYLRGKHGARVFYRRDGEHSYEILAKSSKKNEQQVIDKLRDMYGH